MRRRPCRPTETPRSRRRIEAKTVPPAHAAASAPSTRRRSAPRAERRLPELRAAPWTRDRVDGALDELQRRVAARAAPVATIGARFGQVDHGQVLALVADREPAPELGAARLAPADRQLLGREAAGRTLIRDDRSHPAARLARTFRAVNRARNGRSPGRRMRRAARARARSFVPRTSPAR